MTGLSVTLEGIGQGTEFSIRFSEHGRRGDRPGTGVDWREGLDAVISLVDDAWCLRQNDPRGRTETRTPSGRNGEAQPRGGEPEAVRPRCGEEIGKWARPSGSFERISSSTAIPRCSRDKHCRPTCAYTRQRAKAVSPGLQMEAPIRVRASEVF